MQSRLNADGKTTIPAPVWETLGLEPGDLLAYRIEDGRVIVTAGQGTPDNPFHTFSEWDSEADRRAYAEF